MSPISARRGTAAVEFALLLPLLLILLLGLADLGLWLRSGARLGRVAGELCDVIARQNSLDLAGLTALAAAGQRMAGNIDISGSQGATIISAVQGSGGANTMLWQKRFGSSRFSSRFGTAGSGVVLPGQVLLRSGDTAILTELFTSGGPWVIGGFLLGSSGPRQTTSHAIYNPRSALLASEPK